MALVALSQAGRKLQQGDREREIGREEEDRYSNTALSAPLTPNVIPHHCSGHREDKRLPCREHGTGGGEGDEGGVMKGSCRCVGREMRSESLISALTATTSFQTWQRKCAAKKKNLSDRKEPESARIIGKKIACEMRPKSIRPRNEKTNRQTGNTACLYQL